MYKYVHAYFVYVHIEHTFCSYVQYILHFCIVIFIVPVIAAEDSITSLDEVKNSEKCMNLTL